MRRVLLALLAAGPLAGLALAADPPKIVGGTISAARVKVEGDRMVSIIETFVPVKRAVLGGDGKEVILDTPQKIISRSTTELKYLVPTGVDGKELPATEFAEMLKEERVVVRADSQLDPEWAAKFHKDTVFVTTGIPTATGKPDPKAAKRDPLPFKAKEPANFTLGHARLKGESVEFTTTAEPFVNEDVREVVKKDGKDVVVVSSFQKRVRTTSTNPTPLKNMIVTTSDGKVLKGEALAKRLAEPVMAVQTPAHTPVEWRKMFADDILFLTLSYP